MLANQFIDVGKITPKTVGELDFGYKQLDGETTFYDWH